MRNEPMSCVSPAPSAPGVRELKPMPSDPPAISSLEHLVSKPLIAAIAEELRKLRGGNEVLNWLEAEILLQNALAADQSFDRDPHERIGSPWNEGLP
jgi:hypothetical protein